MLVKSAKFGGQILSHSRDIRFFINLRIYSHLLETLMQCFSTFLVQWNPK